jgi:hypothetical protein
MFPTNSEGQFHCYKKNENSKYVRGRMGRMMEIIFTQPQMVKKDSKQNKENKVHKVMCKNPVCA